MALDFLTQLALNLQKDVLDFEKNLDNTQQSINNVENISKQKTLSVANQPTNVEYMAKEEAMLKEYNALRGIVLRIQEGYYIFFTLIYRAHKNVVKARIYRYFNWVKNVFQFLRISAHFLHYNSQNSPAKSPALFSFINHDKTMNIA